MTTYHFGQFTPDHLAKMEEGVKLFNQQKYWECHEALEDVWMEDQGDPARNVYWAVIQVAASCFHYREGNLVGTKGMLYKAKEKFRKCREQGILTEVALKYLDWGELEETVFAVPSQDPTLQDFRAVYDFRFKHYSMKQPT